jgi:hypothetical protein
MPWWEIVVFFAAVILAIYGFASIVGFRTRSLSRRTDRTAENMYDNYAELTPRQRRQARERDGGRSG